MKRVPRKTLLPPTYPEQMIGDQKVIWRPQPGAQEAFMSSSNIFEVLIEGNRGGGKTDCLADELLYARWQGFW